MTGVNPILLPYLLSGEHFFNISCLDMLSPEGQIPTGLSFSLERRREMYEVAIWQVTVA